MPSLVVIGPQIKEKHRGTMSPPAAYMVPKDPSLNKVKENRLEIPIWIKFFKNILIS